MPVQRLPSTSSFLHSFAALHTSDCDPPASTSPPRESKGLPDAPDSLEALVDTCLQLYQDPPHGPLTEAAQGRLVETLNSLVQDCLNGTQLDLQYFGEAGLPDEYPAPGDAPLLAPQAWALLDGYVRVREGRGIGTLLVDGLQNLPSIAAGAGCMPDLDHLSLRVPERPADAPRRTIDLRPLRPKRPQALTVRIHGDHSNLRVQLPRHVSACASGISPAESPPSFVEYFEGQSQTSTGSPRPLSGAVYCDAPPQLDQKMASSININGGEVRRGDGNITWYGVPKKGEPLTCQSNSTVWILAQYQKARDGKAGDRNSGLHDHAADAEAVAKGFAAAYTDQAALQEDRLTSGAVTDAICDLDHFGAMLAAEQAALTPGESRWYHVNTPNHVMAMQLSLYPPEADDDPALYVAILYEPNGSVIRHSLSSFDPGNVAGIGMDSWLTPKQQQDFFPGDSKIATLTRWIPPDDTGAASEHARPSEPALHVAPEQIGTPGFLMAAMDNHAPGCVTRSIAAILDTKGPEPERVEQLQAADMDGRTALAWAGMRNQPDNVRAYVRGILSAPEDRLSIAAKVQLLQCDDPDDGGPFLWHLAAKPFDFWPEAVIHSYVHEIASSSLPLAYKVWLLGRRHALDDGGEAPDTAPGIALRHAPVRTLAIMCAIFEARQPYGPTCAMLEALDVQLDEVLEACKACMRALSDSTDPLAPHELDYVGRWLDRLGDGPSGG